jgi:nitrogen fixation NifU-like protein
MMPELRELYQEMVLDHGRRPRNFRVMADADRSAEGHNPLCGDRVTLYLRLGHDRIDEISFQGRGCAISMASASMLTETLAGKSLAEVQRIVTAFHALLTAPRAAQEAPVELGKLAALSGVRSFPVRVKCATLPWHALKAALERAPLPATTE